MRVLLIALLAVLAVAWPAAADGGFPALGAPPMGQLPADPLAGPCEGPACPAAASSSLGLDGPNCRVIDLDLTSPSTMTIDPQGCWRDAIHHLIGWSSLEDLAGGLAPFARIDLETFP